MPAPTPSQEEEVLRTQLIELIRKANGPALARFHTKITKKHMHRSCAVQSAPKEDWRPRQPDEALRLVQLLKDQVGLRTTPYPVNDTEHSCKIMLSVVCHVLLRERSDMPADRSSKLKAAAAATSLACRVCEEAQRIRNEGGGVGVVEMHGSRQGPVWEPAARGSGIVLTKNAWPLFETALERVRERIVVSA